MAPGLAFLMSSIAFSGDDPYSMRAIATKTGALFQSFYRIENTFQVPLDNESRFSYHFFYEETPFLPWDSCHLHFRRHSKSE